MKFIIEYIKSMRLYYAFVTGIPGWIGVAYYEYLAEKSGLPELGMTNKIIILTGLFLSWGINQIINDYLGMKEDKINAPDRSMVSGKLHPQKALAVSILFIIITFAVTILYLEPVAVIPLAAGLLLNVLYEYAKGHGIAGNIVFGIMIAMCPLFGFMAAGGFKVEYLTSNVISVLIMTAVINGVMTFYTYFKDYKGDKQTGKKTIIVSYGLRAARWFALAAAILPAVVFLFLFVSGILKIALTGMFVFLGIVSAALFLWTGILYFRNPFGEKTYYSLEMNFKACTCSQAALIAIFNDKLAAALFILSYILVEFLFGLYKNSKS